MTKYVLYIIFLFIITSATAQVDDEAYTKTLDYKGIIYNREIYGELKLHTNGCAIGLNFGKFRTYYHSKYYNVELGIMGDPREQKQSGIILPSYQLLSDSYKFGKQNSMFVLRAGFGNKKYITEKGKRRGVSVGYDYSYGPALALLKPYYLNILYRIEEGGQTRDEIRPIKYSEENAAKFLDISQIFGYAGFSKGFSEMKLVPGIQGKGSLFFSVGSYDKYLKALEVGIMADIFIHKIPIMIETEAISNKPYFINLFLNLQLGRRSN